MKKLPRVAKTLIRVFISLALITILLYTQDLKQLQNALLTYNFWYILLGLFFILIGTYVSALRWQAILTTSNYNIPAFRLFSLYLRGYFYNNFLPTQLGGDVYKAAAVGIDLKNQSVGFFSVFIDRFSGLLVLLFIGFIGLSSLKGFYWVLGAFLITLIGLILYFPVLRFLSKYHSFLKKFYDASLLLVKDKKTGVKILFLSLLVQVFSYSMSYVLFLGAGVQLTIIQVIAIFPLASLILIVPSWNGFGLQDFTYVKLFSYVGIIASISVAVSIMTHIVRVIMSLIGGVFILFNVGPPSGRARSGGKQ